MLTHRWCHVQRRHGFEERGLTVQLWLDDLPPPTRAVSEPDEVRLDASKHMPATQLVLPLGALARDWTRIRLNTLPRLRELTPRLDEDLRSKAVDQRWSRSAHRSAKKLLAVVVMHGTPAQPFTVTELNVLCQRVIRPQIGVHRVADLLVQNGMLVIEPTACRDERWVGGIWPCCRTTSATTSRPGFERCAATGNALRRRWRGWLCGPTYISQNPPCSRGRRTTKTCARSSATTSRPRSPRTRAARRTMCTPRCDHCFAA